MSKVLKSLVKEKSRLFNFIVKSSEEKAIKEKADKYANGDMSKWIRHAAMNYKPSREELKNEG